MTINQFLKDYGVQKGHLAQFGITFYKIVKYGDVDIDELPVDIHIMFTAILNRYGYFCEGCNEGR